VSDAFPIQNGRKMEMICSHSFKTLKDHEDREGVALNGTYLLLV
jgi:hypothetical protein